MGKPLPIMPRPGVVRGATDQMSPDRWWDMNLVRFRGGQLIPIGGNIRLPEAEFDTPPRDVLTWHANNGERWAAAGSDNRLYAYNSETETVYDITPAGVGPLDPPGAAGIGYGAGDYGMEDYGTARTAASLMPGDISAVMGDWWSLATFGEDLMVVPSQDGGLYRWSPTSPATPAAIVPTAPTDNRAVFVTDERFVVLLGAGGNMRKVQWCDQEDPDTWTPADDNAAGSLSLETEGSPLVGRRLTAGMNLIFTDTDCHAFRWVGPPYFYGRERLEAGAGLISPRAVSIAGQSAIWMATQGFFQFSGAVQPLPCDVQDWLFSLINRDMVGRIFAFPNPAFREHWFFWPDEGAAGECNRYVAVNYAERGAPWIIGQADRTAGDIFGAMSRPVTGRGEADGTGTLRLEEYGWTDDGASRVGSIFAETGGIDLANGETRLNVLQIEQDYDGPPAALAYRFFLRERAMAAETVSGPYPITRTDGLVDCRLSTRRMRMRIEATQDMPWALGITRLDVSPAGRQ